MLFRKGSELYRYSTPMTRNLVISVILSCLLGGGVAHAATTVPVAPAVSAEAPAPVLVVQRQISASEAKSIARRQVPGGEVVDISRNGSVYRVRIVARSGRVVDVLVDANTGRVVG